MGLTNIGNDFAEQAKIASERLVELLKEEKPNEETYQVAIMQGVPTAPNHRIRYLAHKEVFDKYTNVELVAEGIDNDSIETAQKQASMFKEYMDISGVIITKMDGTGKGGGALSACSAVEAPVRFIGVGENIQDLERFNAQNFVSELLGMGDIEGLLEKARLALDEKDAKNLEAKLMKGEFDLDDLASQMKAMGKMGSMSKMLNMIPGMGNLNISKDQLGAQEEKIQKWEVAMSSMTKEERKKPEVMNNSRIDRIARGSGVMQTDIRELLKQYKMMKKMVGMFKNPENFKGMSEDDMQSPDAMMKMMKKAGGGKFMKQMMRRR